MGLCRACGPPRPPPSRPQDLAQRTGPLLLHPPAVRAALARLSLQERLYSPGGGELTTPGFSAFGHMGHLRVAGGGRGGGAALAGGQAWRLTRQPAAEHWAAAALLARRHAGAGAGSGGDGGGAAGVAVGGGGGGGAALWRMQLPPDVAPATDWRRVLGLSQAW